ncbi:hypothetical protein SCP_0300160 [Sparassis crispa]|uniref:NADP-dependent oxidoreductase domain-containing protein n=1 Tax=Sparassis crispa TaxID=139825 RepID=A0A401GDT7_9APHY|nr:hypothetical protein SCP_0300160 [Sparassis crispa]GBE80301.1 hypothetical protein SCP_0300160 [Sparassis crispa]
MPLLGLGGRELELHDRLYCSLKHGYRLGHLNSARFYANEAEVGNAVRESGFLREEIFITIKVMSDEHGYANMLKAVDNSLKWFSSGAHPILYA